MKKAITLSLVALLYGCSTYNPEKKSEDYNYKLANSDKLIEVEKTKPRTFTYPEWYISFLVKDGYISASGTDISADPKFAVDKAMMNAKKEIATYLNSTTSNISKDFTREYESRGNIVRNRVVTQASKVHTPSIVLEEVVREKVLLVKEGEYYRAFVRVHMSLSNATAAPSSSSPTSINNQNIDRISNVYFNELSR